MLTYIKKKLLFKEHVCPWWLAYTFDNRIRKKFHDPDKILKPYIKKGMTLLDIGCGMGYFSIAMAGLTGSKGRVIALDIQERMLGIMKKRASHAGVIKSIIPVLAKENDLCMSTKVDFVLSFWMLHEIPDKKRFLKQVFDILKAKGRYLIVEPKIHTSAKYFIEIEDILTTAGFRILERPAVALSRAVLLGK
jgi:ubiquinone/menaquinone biosynthesis C-methylase UbiE